MLPGRWRNADYAAVFMRLPLRYRLTAAGLLVSVVSVLAAWSPATSAAPAAGSTVGGPELATHGVVQAAHTKPLPERVTTSSWLVADAGTGVVLAAKDPHGRFLPASTQKVLTALTLLPRLKDRSPSWSAIRPTRTSTAPASGWCRAGSTRSSCCSSAC